MENNKEGNILRPDFSQESEVTSVTKEAGLAAGQQEKVKKQINVLTSHGPKTFNLEDQEEKKGKIIPFPKKQLVGA